MRGSLPFRFCHPGSVVMVFSDSTGPSGSRGLRVPASSATTSSMARTTWPTTAWLPAGPTRQFVVVERSPIRTVTGPASRRFARRPSAPATYALPMYRSSSSSTTSCGRTSGIVVVSTRASTVVSAAASPIEAMMTLALLLTLFCPP